MADYVTVRQQQLLYSSFKYTVRIGLNSVLIAIQHSAAVPKGQRLLHAKKKEGHLKHKDSG
jgi:hypothetical protein